MRKIILALALFFAVVPSGIVDAGLAPVSSIKQTTTIIVDGISTGTVQLSSLTVTNMPSNSTWVWVKSIGDWFTLVDPTGASAQPNVVVTATDGRQFIRRSVPNRQFLAATYWSYSPSTGSDEAVGWGMSESEADSHPLATMHELNRRLVGWNEDNTAAGLTDVALSIHQLNDCQSTSCFAILTNLKVHNGEKYIRYRGTLTPVDGSASNLTIATYQAAVPASNTEREITITGLGTTPTYVGKIIQTVDGTKTATVSRQNSSGHLSLGQVRDSHGGINGDGSNVTDFSAGDHVTIYDASKLANWPFPATGSVFFPILANVRLDVGSSGITAWSSIGPPPTNPQILECILGSGVPNAEEYFLDGGTLFIGASVLYATHANYIYDGAAQLGSVVVLVGGDGPLIENEAITIGDEALFTPIGGGGVGIRNIGTAKSSVTVIDQGSIASFGMNNSTIDLVNSHGGIPGDFVGSDSNTGFKSLWYGSGNLGNMIVLPKGTRSKFPKSGLTVTTSASHTVNLAGIGVSDAFHNYSWSDIPIVDLASGSTFLDSNPGTSGGAF